MTTKRHIHKYHKVNGVWACALPDCTHFMPKNVSDHVPGKRSICWSCGNPIILDDTNMLNDEPVCLECSGADIQGLDDLLASKGIV